MEVCRRPKSFEVSFSSECCFRVQLSKKGAQSLVFNFGVTCVFFSWVTCVFLFWVTGVSLLLSKQQLERKPFLASPGLSVRVYSFQGFGLGVLLCSFIRVSVWVCSFSTFRLGLLLLGFRAPFLPLGIRVSDWV